MSSSLYVGGLSPAVGNHDLFKVFSQPFEEDNSPSGLVSTKVNRDVHTRSSRCSGFLNFASADAAARTLEQRQHVKVGDKAVVLKSYRPKDAAGAEGGLPVDSVDSMCNTFVTPVPETMNEAELKAIFDIQFPGVVSSCHVPPGKLHGYVQFSNEEAANAAVIRGRITFTGAPAPVQEGDECPEEVVHEMNIFKYKSFTERKPKTPPGPKKAVTAPQLNRQNCVAIRGAPQGWKEQEFKDAVTVYGQVAYIKLGDSRHHDRTTVVEFVDSDSTFRCMEGLNKRWCSQIDCYTLLDPNESQRYSLIWDRHRGEAASAPPRLMVSLLKNENQMRKPKQSRKTSNGKSRSNKQDTIEGRAPAHSETVPEILAPATPSMPAIVIDTAVEDTSPVYLSQDA